MKTNTKSKIKFESKVLELKYLGIYVVPEFKFCKNRKFKADFMTEYKDKKIIIEYEGIFKSKESDKSRHTTVGGYSKDCQKYNLATVLGFYILRYTAKNYREVTGDVLKIFQIKRSTKIISIS